MNARTLRSAWTEIDLDNLRYNFNSVKEKVRLAGNKSEVIPIVKADAYGHGAVRASQALLKENATSFGVATLEEAVELREAGIDVPILILGLTPRKYANEIVKHNLISVVSTLEDAQILNDVAVEFGAKPEVLAAVETGMGRVGFTHTKKHIDDVIAIDELSNVKLKGIFSHFATADEADRTYALEQIERFEAFERRLKDAGLSVEYRTMANSAAIINYTNAHYDAVRPGIVLYGCYPSEEVERSLLSIKPVMSVKSNIVLLKKLPKGSGISYGRKFVTDRESLIGTLPLGYADGLPRYLSGKGRVIIQGHFAPIVGRICMDQCMIDVTDIPGVKEYDEVVLMGRQGDTQILADEIGEKTGTINYEVTCRFGQRLPKVFK